MSSVTGMAHLAINSGLTLLFCPVLSDHFPSAPESAMIKLRGCVVASWPPLSPPYPSHLSNRFVNKGAVLSFTLCVHTYIVFVSGQEDSCRFCATTTANN